MAVVSREKETCIFCFCSVSACSCGGAEQVSLLSDPNRSHHVVASAKCIPVLALIVATAQQNNISFELLCNI